MTHAWFQHCSTMCRVPEHPEFSNISTSEIWNVLSSGTHWVPEHGMPRVLEHRMCLFLVFCSSGCSGTQCIDMFHGPEFEIFEWSHFQVSGHLLLRKNSVILELALFWNSSCTGTRVVVELELFQYWSFPGTWVVPELEFFWNSSCSRTQHDLRSVTWGVPDFKTFQNSMWLVFRILTRSVLQKSSCSRTQCVPKLIVNPRYSRIRLVLCSWLSVFLNPRCSRIQVVKCVVDHEVKNETTHNHWLPV